MDVYNMYVGDCASAFRMNMFRDYEKHPYGTFEGNCQQQQQKRKSYYTMVQGKYTPRADSPNYPVPPIKNVTFAVLRRIRFRLSARLTTVESERVSKRESDVISVFLRHKTLHAAL